MLTLIRLVSKKVCPTRGEMRVVLLGLDHAGKSALHSALQRQVFGKDEKEATDDDTAAATYRPTTGQSVAKGGAHGRMWSVVDVGGGERQRRAWSNYLGDAQFVAWVVDAADSSRLAESARCLHAVLDDPAMEHCPVVILATKPPKLTNAQITEAFKAEGVLDSAAVVLVMAADAGSPLGAATQLVQWLSETAKTSPLMLPRSQAIARLAAEAM